MPDVRIDLDDVRPRVYRLATYLATAIDLVYDFPVEQCPGQSGENETHICVFCLLGSFNRETLEDVAVAAVSFLVLSGVSSNQVRRAGGVPIKT